MDVVSTLRLQHYAVCLGRRTCSARYTVLGGAARCCTISGDAILARFEPGGLLAAPCRRRSLFDRLVAAAEKTMM